MRPDQQPRCQSARWCSASTAQPGSPACWRLAHSPRRTRRATPKPRRSKQRSASIGMTRSRSCTLRPEPSDVDREDGNAIWGLVGLFGCWLDRYAADLEPGSVRVLLIVATCVLFAYAPLGVIALKCLVPGFDGALFSSEWKDALWAQFCMGAPARRRQCVE